MSAAAIERSAIAAAGMDLLAAIGGPGERRAAALLRRLAGTPSPARPLMPLGRVPAWLRLPLAARRRLAERVALIAIAPSLAQSIDGRELGEIARLVGDDALDAALDRTDGPGLAPVAATDLAALGLALMRRALPEEQRMLLDESDAPAPDCEPAFAAGCIDRALAMAAA